MALLDSLNELQQQIPGLSQEVTKRQQAASRLAGIQALKQAPVGMGATQAAQSLAPQTVKAQAQVADQGAQQAQQQMGQVAQLGLQEQASQQAVQLQRQQLGQQSQLNQERRQAQSGMARQQLNHKRELTETEIRTSEALQDYGIIKDNHILDRNLQQDEDLNAFKEGYADRVFGSRENFRMEQGQQKIATARQLADWSISESRNENEAKARLQEIQNAFQNEMQYKEILHNTLMRKMKQDAERKGFAETAKVEREIQAMQQAHEREIARKKATRAEINNYVSGAFTIGGAVAGTMVGGPAGGAAGATVGSSIGNMASTWVGNPGNKGTA